MWTDWGTIKTFRRVWKRRGGKKDDLATSVLLFVCLFCCHRSSSVPFALKCCIVQMSFLAHAWCKSPPRVDRSAVLETEESLSHSSAAAREDYWWAKKKKSARVSQVTQGTFVLSEGASEGLAALVWPKSQPRTGVIDFQFLTTLRFWHFLTTLVNILSRNNAFELCHTSSLRRNQ